MKVKELIEELQKYNPDGVVSVTTISKRNKTEDYDCRVEAVEDNGCALINPIIIARI